MIVIFLYLLFWYHSFLFFTSKFFQTCKPLIIDFYSLISKKKKVSNKIPFSYNFCIPKYLLIKLLKEQINVSIFFLDQKQVIIKNTQFE